MLSLSGATIAAIERRQKVLERESVSYDYEKVFWSSLWSFGLIGLGYVTLKFTDIVRSGQKVVFAGSNPELATYLETYEYVEGSKKDVDLSTLKYVSQATYIENFRLDAEAWAAEKASAAEKWPEYVVVSGDPAVDRTDKMLDMVNRISNKLLPVLPIGMLGFHVVSEKIRVKRMEGALSD